jgi:putative PIN family toxin of toxin-antitoxin system
MIWARGFVRRNLDAVSVLLVQAWKDHRFRALVSGELLDEIAGTLVELGAERPDVTELIMILALHSQIVAIRHQRMGCEDEEDDHLLETAVSGNADYLVSEDRAVYRLPRHVHDYMTRRGVRVCRANEFYADLDSIATG